MEEYEYRLVTKVTQGDPGDDYMGNLVVSYVSLGQWGGEVSTDSPYESEMEIFNEDLTNKAIATITKRRAVVNLDPEVMLTDQINFRSTPVVATDNIIGTIPNGTELDVYIMYDNSDWLKTSYNGQEGYVQRQINNVPLFREIKPVVPTVTYELQTEAPEDWESNYMNYFMKDDDGHFVHVEGVPDEENPETIVAPIWEADKYYTETTVLDGDIEVGDLVSIKESAYKWYDKYDGKDVAIPAWVKAKNWYVQSITSFDTNRIVIDDSEDNENHINSPIARTDLNLVRKKNVVPPPPEPEPEPEEEV